MPPVHSKFSHEHTPFRGLHSLLVLMPFRTVVLHRQGRLSCTAKDTCPCGQRTTVLFSIRTKSGRVSQIQMDSVHDLFEVVYNLWEESGGIGFFIPAILHPFKKM